jgi:hypothetical protein
MSTDEQPTQQGSVDADPGNPPGRKKEPSMAETATEIAERLGAPDQLQVIQKIVWDLGRTQARALLAETFALEAACGMTLPGSPERALPIAVFRSLVETKGIKKERPARGGSVTRHRAVVERIAAELQETTPPAQAQIERIVRHLGEEQALAYLQKTKETEAAGGLMLPDRSRRRTPGGVFFYLVREGVGSDLRKRLFPSWPPASKKVSEHPPSPPQPQAPVLPMASWTERVSMLAEIHEKGQVSSVKVTLIGRPGSIVERQDCVALLMQQAPKVPALPKGLPLPPVDEVAKTTYQVYVGKKQWRQVEEAIKSNPDDVLVIEGWQMFDEKHQQIAVYALNTTTKMLQQAKRAAQQNK